MARIDGGCVGGAGFVEDPAPSLGDAAAADGPPSTQEAQVVRGSAPSAAFQTRTALQRHADYFDVDRNGVVTVAETDQRMRELGLAGITSKPTAFVINAGLGADTMGRAGLDVSADDIHKGIHEGDTGVFDAQGNFDAGKLESLWQRFDTNADGELTLAEVNRMIDTNNGGAWLSKGLIASRGEWYLLLDLAGQDRPDGTRVLTRERVQSFYDGTLFWDIRASRMEEAARTGSDLHDGDVNRGVAGLTRTLGGVFAGSAAGAALGAVAAVGDDAARILSSPLSGAMLACCPGIKSRPG